jgi:hypothetical protein
VSVLQVSGGGVSRGEWGYSCNANTWLCLINTSQITKTLTKFTEAYEKLVTYLSLNETEQHKVGAKCISDKRQEKYIKHKNRSKRIFVPAYTIKAYGVWRGWLGYSSTHS